MFVEGTWGFRWAANSNSVARVTGSVEQGAWELGNRSSNCWGVEFCWSRFSRREKLGIRRRICLGREVVFVDLLLNAVNHFNLMSISAIIINLKR